MDFVMRRVHVIISGMVQGVCFRAETRHTAQALGIKGWVRNLPDGKVEAAAEGEDGAIEQFIKYCHKGPPGARVTKVGISEEGHSDEFSNFEISL